MARDQPRDLHAGLDEIGLAQRQPVEGERVRHVAAGWAVQGDAGDMVGLRAPGPPHGHEP